LYKRALEARNFIGQHLSKIDVMNFVTFEEWVGTKNLDISAYDPEMLEKEYDRQVEQQASLLSENERIIRATRRPDIIRLRTPHISPAGEWLELDHLEDRLNKVTDEISALERREIADLDVRIKTFSYPPNLGWGLVVLGCFAFFSIVMPVMLIMVGNWGMAGIYSKPVEQFIFVLLVLGLVAVFVYIALLIVELRRK